MSSKRFPLPSPPLSEELQAVLEVHAKEQAQILFSNAVFAEQHARLDGTNPQLKTVGCVDRWKLRDEILRRKGLSYPLDLAELLVIAYASAETCKGKDSLATRLVRDVLRRRAHEVLLETPQAFSNQVQVLPPRGTDHQPLWYVLVSHGVGLDGVALQPLLKTRGRKYIDEMLKEEADGLERDFARRSWVGTLLRGLGRADSLAALFQLGLPVSALGFSHLIDLGRKAGAAAARSEAEYRSVVRLLDLIAERSSGCPGVLMHAPIQEVLREVDTAWSSAKNIHPLYAAIYALTTEAANSDPTTRDTQDFPGRPLLELSERLNALLAPDGRLPLDRVPPRELLKLSTLCVKASEHGNSITFYNSEAAFAGRRRNSPDDVLLWIATQHVSHGDRLMPDDLRARTDAPRMRELLGDGRYSSLERLALENLMRARIDAVQETSPEAASPMPATRRRARL